MDTWHWQEVNFVPERVLNKDMLRFQGHIFVRSDVVEELKVRGLFGPKEKKPVRLRGDARFRKKEKN